MKIRFLGKTPLAQIVDCFNQAFADYIVPLQVEEEQMRRRWLSCRGDYGLSFGAFDGEQLVGLMMTGIDHWQGQKTAYNSGTGVIPSHRGQRIVQQLYAAALPSFRENGIQKCTLEVILGNEKALRAYTRVGFQKRRTLQCFKLKEKFELELDIKSRKKSRWHLFRRK